MEEDEKRKEGTMNRNQNTEFLAQMYNIHAGQGLRVTIMDVQFHVCAVISF